MFLARYALLLALLAAIALVPARPAAAQPAAPAAACQDAPLPSGAAARACLPPAAWDDALVYVPGFAPEPGFRNLTLPDGQPLPDLITGAGLAFATTSGGLADDTSELVDALPALLGRVPRRVLLAGVSQGGLVVTQLAERTPGRFAGALALCGPLGEYRSQVDYFGDARALFDSFFPGVLPGDAATVPQQLKDGWESTYAPAVAAALAADPGRAAQLLAVAGIPVDHATPERAAETTVASITGVLWYQVFASDVARARFGGNPYGNRGRVYSGSDDDAALNAAVARFDADPAALEAMRAEDTTGRIRIPLVVMHTTGDEIVPFQAAGRYLEQARAAGLAGNVTLLPVQRYGHCAFQSDELLRSFFLLNQQVEARLRVFLPLVAQ